MKLQKIILYSVPLHLIHAVEVNLFQLQSSDNHYLMLNTLFQTKAYAFYWGLHLSVWVFLIIGYLLAYGSAKVKLIGLGFYGYLLVSECHHVVKAVLSGSYNGGLVTGLLFPILSFIFWKEFIKEYKTLS